MQMFTMSTLDPQHAQHLSSQSSMGVGYNLRDNTDVAVSAGELAEATLLFDRNVRKRKGMNIKPKS